LRIVLEPFAQACLEGRFGGVELSTSTRAALEHYARRSRSQTPPPGLPDLRREAPGKGPVEGTGLELTLPRELEALLRRAARRSAVSVDVVVSHAVFVYVADLEAPADAAIVEEPAPLGRYRQRECLHRSARTSRTRRSARLSDPFAGRGRRGRVRRGRFGKR